MRKPNFQVVKETRKVKSVKLPLKKMSTEDISIFIKNGWRVRSSHIHVLPQ